MLNKNTEFVVFDVETTGLSPARGDKIIEIAAVKVKDKNIIDSFDSLINPGRDIPEEAQKINNITSDMVAGAPMADEVLSGMIDFIGGACLVGHNISFDLNFLCCELAAMGRKLHDTTPAVDTLRMTRKLLPHLKNFQLTNIAYMLGIKVEGAHRAMADVHITAKVLRSLLDFASDQKIDNFVELHRMFGVQKPNYPVAQGKQGSLF